MKCGVSQLSAGGGVGGFPSPPMDRRTPHPVRLRPQSFCDLVPADGMYCPSGWRLDSEIQESSGLVPPGTPGAVQASPSSEWFLGVRSGWLHRPKLCFSLCVPWPLVPSYEDLSPDHIRPHHHLSSSARVLFPRKVISDVPGGPEWWEETLQPTTGRVWRLIGLFLCR